MITVHFILRKLLRILHFQYKGLLLICVFCFCLLTCIFFSVNTAPEDFSLKPPSVASEITSTVDVKEKKETINATVNGGFNLTSNKPAADLRFMYSQKKSESPKPPMFGNNADPYIGSGLDNDTSNDEPTPPKQRKYDHPSAQQPMPFVPTTAQSNNLAVTSFTSYLNANGPQSLPADSSSEALTRNRPGSGPPGKYNPEALLPTTGYRPSSANIFTNTNRGHTSDIGVSFVHQSSNVLPSSKIPTPPSSSPQNASPAERPPSSAMVHPGTDYTSSTSFKPLTANNSNQNHPPQIYSQQTPSPHSYRQGPSPPLPG